MSSTFRYAAAAFLLAAALASLASTGPVAGRDAAVAPTGTAVIFETGRAVPSPTAASVPSPAGAPPVLASATPFPAIASATPPPGIASVTSPSAAAPLVLKAQASSPTAKATATVAATLTPTPNASPTAPPPLFVPATPTPVPLPLSFGALDRAIIYDNGYQVALIGPDGSGHSGLSFLSAASARRPRFSGGWQYIYYNNGFWLGDIYGHQQSIAAPVVPGEQVYDAIPSPNGQYIAWQMVTPATIGGNTVNTGAGRIVITDSTGGNAHTLLQQSAGATYGDIPLLYGWRPGHPPTVLVQTNYALPSMLGLHKGLEEFDPAIDDVVNDYLPPLDQGTLPQGEVLGISASGATIVFATQDTLLPSGEGPFPVDLKVMTAANRRITSIDVAAAHQDKATALLPAPRASIFYRQAFISPDNSRIAYTLLDILYPKGATRPYVRPIAYLANLDGSGKVEIGADQYAAGWADGHTLVVQRVHTHTDGLYAVNLNTGKTTRIMLGNGLRVDGIVP
ncbi:MAG TPA: hypothetical protein VHB98_12575 [Chloroflexota bacterium]|nr:hypothetical protein [Chloroflexota bacterium]